ncbi:hypothetical protein HOT75_gp117 [Gordonia phage Daredevil]|uniref:Uncharacterized protein n=1 Tax=Gordonia phage Daredevil TaxID=2283286 RepID=A0A345MIX3_9CAUD|nr:hypothetical protein HOT75_gp117 [Gordonia phage Daredevil]AXH70504.1 hypothetical protein SEA_DAREDEVIL_117 [Gordonia phage Daredevil]
MTATDCGGCRGLGGHSPRCHTQPGAHWRRLEDLAERLGDSIGPNDMAAANMAYAVAGRMRARHREEVERARAAT